MLGAFPEAWCFLIPNARLTPGLLPAPQAEWSALSPFAVTFDGYRICPDIAVAAPLLEEARRTYQADGTVPGSLTMARALLFFEQRADHFGGGYSPPEMRFVHALVEQIRERVETAHPGVPASGLSADEDALDRVMDAFERFVLANARWGGYRYHGWTDYSDPENFFGPLIYSEADCALRLAYELEREWPGGTHLELAVSKANFGNFDPDSERKQFVDLAVSDMSTFVPDQTSQERFRTHRYEAFIEVKWFGKGSRHGAFEYDARKRVNAVPADLDKLARHLRLGRSRVAAMLVVDDEDYFEEHGTLDWPAGVWRLIVGPALLRRYGLLAAPA